MSEADARRAAVLAALAERQGEAVSGEHLAGRLGCSRAAVHRHVEALRRDGLPVAGAGGGYVLDAGADVVVPSLVEARMRPPLAGPVRWVAETTSTNDDAAAAGRRGAPEGLVTGADRQRAGRGRRGRPWVAEEGGALLVSALLRPPVPPAGASTLPLLVAVAVADACGAEARIVWPNDIVVGGGKVAGVLVELSADHERVQWAVAGVGINLRSAPELPDARWTPRALADGRRRADVLVDLLGALGDRYGAWCAGGPEAALAEYAGRDALRGHPVRVATDGGEVVGTASGVDEIGRLRVVTAAGEQAVSVGEVTRVESPG